jgi:hypothetical protein
LLLNSSRSKATFARSSKATSAFACSNAQAKGGDAQAKGGDAKAKEEATSAFAFSNAKAKEGDAQAKGGDAKATEADSQEQACKRGRFSITSEKGGERNKN